MTALDPTTSTPAETAVPPVAPSAELDNLLYKLQTEPWSLHFYMAVRRLECVYTNLPRIGCSQRPEHDPTRFRQEPSLSFAPATLSAFDPASARGPALMAVDFLGLLGPNGPLPLHITEYVRDRKLNNADPTLARFLDVFNHRSVSLFYRAWAVNQQTVSFDRARVPGAREQDRFAAYIGALFGIAMDAYRNRDAVPDVAKLHYSGRLTHTPRNAEGLCAILADFFGVPARIIEFVGQWIELPPDARCLLGQSRQTGVLGSTAIVGSRIWDCQYKFRIRLGPLNFSDYVKMLPGGGSLQRLIAWVRNYLGQELACDLQLVLKKEEVPACQVGKGGRLGWSTWLKTKPTPKDAEDLVLNICP